MKYILTLAGALLNRIRGGLWEEVIPANKIYFPIYLGFIAGYFKGLGLEAGICTALACYVGQQIVGWGAYIATLTVGTGQVPEAALIDEIIDNCRLTIRGKTYWLKDYPRAWGFAGLFFRGLVWSLLVGLAVNSIPVILCGALMPVCYLIPTLILWKTKYHTGRTSWDIGEIIWGGVFSAAVIW